MDEAVDRDDLVRKMEAEGKRNRERRLQVILGMSTTLDEISQTLEGDLESLSREQMLFMLQNIQSAVARTPRS